VSKAKLSAVVVSGLLSAAVYVPMATPAYAAECGGTGIPTFCLEEAGKLVEFAGSEKYTGQLVTGTVARFSVEGGPTITCHKDASKGEIVQPEPLVKPVVSKFGTLTFTECKVTNSAETEANCVIKEPIVTASLEGSVTDEVPIKDGVVKAETGSILATLTIKSAAGKTCIFAKEGQKVSGEQLCTALEAETDKIAHRGTCNGEGSKLLYSEKPATFTSESEVELSGVNKGVKWDVSLG
jgi:hypothetical protein